MLRDEIDLVEIMRDNHSLPKNQEAIRANGKRLIRVDFLNLLNLMRNLTTPAQQRQHIGV